MSLTTKVQLSDTSDAILYHHGVTAVVSDVTFIYRGKTYDKLAADFEYDGLHWVIRNVRDTNWNGKITDKGLQEFRKFVELWAKSNLDKYTVQALRNSYEDAIKSLERQREEFRAIVAEMDKQLSKAQNNEPFISNFVETPRQHSQVFVYSLEPRKNQYHDVKKNLPLPDFD